MKLPKLASGRHDVQVLRPSGIEMPLLRDRYPCEVDFEALALKIELKLTFSIDLNASSKVAVVYLNHVVHDARE